MPDAAPRPPQLSLFKNMAFFPPPPPRLPCRPAAPTAPPPVLGPSLAWLEPRLESPPAAASPQLAALETEASRLPGGIGIPSVGGGSNMVSRDDTSAMLRLVARWLRGEVAELARRAADPTMSMVERGRVIRALLHSLGVLAVFFRCESLRAHPKFLRLVLCTSERFLREKEADRLHSLLRSESKERNMRRHVDVEANVDFEVESTANP